jgi:hypothetical protein
MLGRALPLLALLHIGCNASYGTQPDQAEATKIVWVQQYGVIGHDPPAVQWIGQAVLNCYDNKGWTVEVGDAGTPLCLAGLFHGDDWLAQVAWPPRNELFSTTAFAHELCHALMWLQSDGLDPDPDHTGPCFEPNGGYMQIANAALAAAGL